MLIIGCDVEPESKIICKLAAGEKCPDYCCDVENQCYERKGNYNYLHKGALCSVV